MLYLCFYLELHLEVRKFRTHLLILEIYIR